MSASIRGQTLHRGQATTGEAGGGHSAAVGEGQRGHRPRVGSPVGSSPFQPSVTWSGPFLLFVSIFPVPSPRRLVPNGLFLPVLVPSLASPVLLPHSIFKVPNKSPPSFSKHSDGTEPCPAPQWRGLLALCFGPRSRGGAEMFANLGWGESLKSNRPLPLLHPRNTEQERGAPCPDDKH